jgi:hypothetical protein
MLLFIKKKSKLKIVVGKTKELSASCKMTYIAPSMKQAGTLCSHFAPAITAIAVHSYEPLAKYNIFCAGYEILTAVVTNVAIF